VANFHPCATKFRKIFQHKGVESVRALRSAHDQQATALPLTVELAHFADGGTHGVAGKNAFFHVKAAGVGQRNTNAPRQPSQKAVAGPGDGVLLVQHAGHAQQPCGQHGRKRRISAKSSHNVRPEAAYDAHGLDHGQNHLRASSHGLETTAKQPAHRQPLKGDTRLTHQAFFRPIERTHKQQVGIGIAAPQFLCHSQCRKNVPAGSASRQEDVVHVSAVLEKFISRPTHSMVAKRLLPP